LIIVYVGAAVLTARGCYNALAVGNYTSRHKTERYEGSELQTGWSLLECLRCMPAC